MPVIFITDALIFLLLAMVLVFICYARNHEYLCAPWSQVGRKPMAMASAVVLLFYIIFGLLDTIHYHPKLEQTEVNKNNTNVQYSTEILSLLDTLLTHLRNNTEKTYSAPFASFAFSKETVEKEDGSKRREYPRLLYGGSHLENPAKEKSSDIIFKSIVAILSGLLLWGFISAVLLALIAKQSHIEFKQCLQDVINKKSRVPWHVVLMTLGIIVVAFSWAFSMSHYYHIFGTDKVGQDVFYQALKGIRTGLVIGTLTTLVMLPFALLLGIMAGYFRGWIDDVIQYIYTTLNSIPGVLLIAAAILMLEVYMSNHASDFTSTAHRADLRLLFLCLILGIMSWTGLCRLLRGEAMKLREIDYVQAAQAFGVSNLTIMLRHLLPNVMHIVMISIVLDFSGLVLAEAVLAYINIGVDPSMSSWGNMINSARLEMAREPIVWWSLNAAFIFMLGLVLAANLFSDAVRDAFDPRIRNERG